jgi:hypothetical protein
MHWIDGLECINRCWTEWGYLKFKMAFVPCIDTRPSEGVFFKRYVNYWNLSALFSEGFQRCIFMRIRFFFKFSTIRKTSPCDIDLYIDPLGQWRVFFHTNINDTWPLFRIGRLHGGNRFFTETHFRVQFEKEKFCMLTRSIHSWRKWWRIHSRCNDDLGRRTCRVLLRNWHEWPSHCWYW